MNLNPLELRPLAPGTKQQDPNPRLQVTAESAHCNLPSFVARNAWTLCEYFRCVSKKCPTSTTQTRQQILLYGVALAQSRVVSRVKDVEHSSRLWMTPSGTSSHVATTHVRFPRRPRRRGLTAFSVGTEILIDIVVPALSSVLAAALIGTVVWCLKCRDQRRNSDSQGEDQPVESRSLSSIFLKHVMG